MPSRGLPLGRYTLYEVIASGGMASVHFGRMLGPAGFTRTVAIKRLHPHLAHDIEFASMFLDEARLAARIQHPNVVQTIDVVALDGELLLVMEYIRGETLSRLSSITRREKKPIPQRVLSAITLGVLYGLHAAHEAKSEQGEPLAIVHRDVSPQNVLVGADGIVRVVDFGVAKAASRAHSTRDGQVKGKLNYMAPEQLGRQQVDRRADVYAVGVMLWECLAAKRLFVADDALAVMNAVLCEPVPPIASMTTDVSDELASVVHRALDRDPARRFATAMEMAEALEAAIPPAPQRELASWVKETAAESLSVLESKLSEIESSTPSHASVPPVDAKIRALSEQSTSVMPAPHEGSVVTGISVVNDTPVRRRTRWPAAFALVLVIASIGGAALWRLRDPVTSASAASSNRAPTNSATATAPSAIPLVSASIAAPSATMNPARPTANAPHVRSAPTTNVPKVPKSCNPPVYVDSAGIEHIKPECL